jgi:hypothetical protein
MRGKPARSQKIRKGVVGVDHVEFPRCRYITTPWMLAQAQVFTRRM